mmetsp:Transcript_26272/g.56890  ORF Transcript_26272/g.56890 Transcript_26272/m.56890 type:complete len:88 (-) Transcript_26272:31-294(-)
MSNYYTVFDRRTSRVGFGLSANRPLFCSDGLHAHAHHTSFWEGGGGIAVLVVVSTTAVVMIGLGGYWFRRRTLQKRALNLQLLDEAY